ncbi:Ig-like domain-containing protein [Xenorhabdus sp. PR6a]|uniref:Ig-like domain-containing protein n=1 Tax=Xenorhabdus sp. PR6a TaxID=3025877 RepID=UPI00235992BA|nr:Ig-like domain-containing protein [Xenorhabdus sp. PR6a]MDC9581519.1 Ig-like domain-containing protein [Xenorhabdus sp. PR6a]
MDAYRNNKVIRFLPYLSFLFVPLISMNVSAAVKIGGVEITSATPEVNGDGKQVHAYRVKVTDAASGNAMPGLTFDRDKVIWQAVHAGGKFDYGQLIKEGKLAFGNPSLTTDEQGYLTATLSSSVGLDDVQARLALVTETGKQESKANTAVKFTTPTLPAGLFVYSYWNSTYDTRDTHKPEPVKTLHRFYRNTEQGPYNIPDSAVAELRVEPNTGLFDPRTETAVTRVVTGKAAAPSGYGNKYWVGSRYKNPVIEPTTLEMTVTHNINGGSTGYTYTLNPQRVFIDMTNRNNSAVLYSFINRHVISLDNCEDNTAKDTGGNTYSPVMLSQVMRTGLQTGSDQTLLDEYLDITQWHLISSVTAGHNWDENGYGTPTRTPIIKVIQDQRNLENLGDMIGFDISSNTILGENEKMPPDAMLLCLFNS